MAYQEIDTSNSNGKGAGDPAKTAFEKAKSMFKEIYDWMASPTITGGMVVNGVTTSIGAGSTNAAATLQVGIGSASTNSYVDLYASGNASANTTTMSRWLVNSAGNTYFSKSNNYYFDSTVTVSAGNVAAPSGYLSSLGTVCRAGVSNAGSGNKYNLNWSGGAVALYIDATLIGNITVSSSDYRIKNDLGELDTSALTLIDDATTKKWEFKDVSDEAWTADGVERWGWIAHELQSVCPQLVQGKKDAVTDDGHIIPQQLDPIGISAVLWKGTQELHALVKAQAAMIDALTVRVAALESPAAASGS